MKEDLEGSEKEFHDPYVEQLQKFIRNVKGSREMEERFMIFEEMLKEERAAGFAKGRAEGVAEGRAEGVAEGRISESKDCLLYTSLMIHHFRQKYYHIWQMVYELLVLVFQ